MNKSDREVNEIKNNLTELTTEYYIVEIQLRELEHKANNLYTEIQYLKSKLSRMQYE